MGVIAAAAARRLIRQSLRRRGFDVIRFEPDRRLSLIERHGVGVVLDVGANDGSFAGGFRDAGYRGRIVSFEPQSAAFARLEARARDDPSWECRRTAVGAHDGEATLHLAANSSSSSLLEMAEQHVRSAPESRYVGVETVPVARLDTLRAEIVHPRERVYLKADVQGLELDVLNGASVLLEQCRIVDVELSLVPLYEGAAALPDVLDYLEERGFVPVWLDPVFADAATGRLLQVDGLFQRLAADD